MRISLNNVWLTNDGSSDLRAWSDAHDVRLNGRQVVQDAQFYARYRRSRWRAGTR